MFKFSLVFGVLFTFLQANTFIVVDIAQGIEKKEYKEVGRLTIPNRKTSKDIYTHKEKVFLYSFNATNAISQEFVYLQRDKDEDGFKEGVGTFKKFFAKIKKYGIKKKKVVGSNIIFLIDTSGSMKKNGVLEDVKNTMKYFINAKSTKAKIAIVTFDGKRHMKESKRAKVLTGFEKSKVKLLRIIDNIEASKNDTFLGSGLSRVQSLLSQVNNKKTMILLFTDGRAVDDKSKALSIIQNFKNNNVKLKVVAVGGADVDMLKSFSTTGHVYDATSTDLKTLFVSMGVGSDEIFLRLNNFFENSPKLTKNDKIIIYSSMMNVDSANDFFIVPNISSKRFYKEAEEINDNRSVHLQLNGAKVYIRLLGKMNATQVNNLKIFYKHYFRDAGGEVIFFANSSLSKVKLK
jgi:uncharacterized protein YegL